MTTAWTVTAMKHGKLIWRGDSFAAARWERAVAYRCGLFVEHYIPTRMEGREILVEFCGLSRMNELARRFDPARLPR